MSVFQRLGRMVHGLRVTPPLPPGRRALVDPHEIDEPGEIDEPDEAWPARPLAGPEQRDHSAPWSAYIRYTDSAGVESKRRITCRQLIGYGRAELVRAHCHERDAVRCFRIDRINELVCVETGEVFDPFERFEDMRLHGAIPVEDKAFVELARVLVFLARCDGEHHALEQAALEHHFGRYAMRFGGDDESIARVLKESGRLAPDGTDFVRSLRKFEHAALAPALCRFVIECASGIIDADGRHAPEELNWGIEMGNALKAVADRG